MKYRFSILLCLFVSYSYAQSVGVRAGLNYSKFSGPLEPGEQFNFTNGFHFGLNYGYKITNKFMVRAELQYSQTGARYKYDGSGHYLIFLDTGREVLELGTNNTVIDVSNGYINLPIVAAYQVVPKIEVFGGVGFNFLANPIGRGTTRFESKDRPTKIVFRQTLDHRYYQDVARGVPFGQSRPIGIIVDEEKVYLSKSAGAYYQYAGKEGSKYNFLDVQATVGLNYFINRGFFFGGKLNYGLLDVSRNSMDRSVGQLNDDKSFILKKDYDRNVNLEVSVGFRF